MADLIQLCLVVMDCEQSGGFTWCNIYFSRICFHPSKIGRLQTEGLCWNNIITCSVWYTSLSLGVIVLAKMNTAPVDVQRKVRTEFPLWWFSSNSSYSLFRDLIFTDFTSRSKTRGNFDAQSSCLCRLILNGVHHANSAQEKKTMVNLTLLSTWLEELDVRTLRVLGQFFLAGISSGGRGLVVQVPQLHQALQTEQLSRNMLRFLWVLFVCLFAVIFVLIFCSLGFVFRFCTLLWNQAEHISSLAHKHALHCCKSFGFLQRLPCNVNWCKRFCFRVSLVGCGCS